MDPIYKGMIIGAALHTGYMYKRGHKITLGPILAGAAGGGWGAWAAVQLRMADNLPGLIIMSIGGVIAFDHLLYRIA